LHRPHWQPAITFPSFRDEIESARPRMTRSTFEAAVKNYLKQQRFRHSLSPALLEDLFKKTSYCQRQIAALTRAKRFIEGAEWRRMQKIFRRLIDKELPRLLTRLEKHLDPEFPATDAFVQSIISRFQEVMDELRMGYRLARNEKAVISGYFRPELESQFMLELENYLKRRLPRPITIAQRRLVIAACAIAGNFFDADAASDDVIHRIDSRIVRARQSHRRDADKWKWVEQESLIEE